MSKEKTTSNEKPTSVVTNIPGTPITHIRGQVPTMENPPPPPPRPAPSKND